MKILALDTTGEFGSIALENGGILIAETHLHSSDGFAHIIFNEIDRLLARAGCDIADIDCFAAASGPGSFTGVRVGMTAVKGLGEALGKPVAAVSKLRALAQFGTTERRAVMIDARRGQIYAAVYDSELHAVIPDAVLKMSAWLHSLDSGEYEFITLANEGLQAALIGTRFEEMKRTSAPGSLASAVASCARLDAFADNLLSPLVADANYVRRSDAELFWKDR
jgi:tRNA threonylcarbamoyladenosine biosynthesis protein TsaB